MIKRTEMTYQEEYDMYMSVEKETLVKMLIEANKHLDRLTNPDKYLFCGTERPLLNPNEM